MNRIAALVFCALSGLAAVAAADPAVEHTASEMVKSASHGHMQVKAFFPGPGGLLGLHLVDDSGAETVGFATPDGAYLLFAPLILDRSGKNLVTDYLAAFAPPAVAAGQPPAAAAPAAGPLASPDVGVFPVDKLNSLAAQPSFVEGHGPVDLWVFGDPRCPHCQDLHQQLQDPALAERYTVHWILTNLIGGADSRTLAGLVLERRMTVDAAYTSDAAPTPAPAADALAKVDASTQLLLDLGPDPRVPFVVYKRKDGAWGTMKGFDGSRLSAIAVATAGRSITASSR